MNYIKEINAFYDWLELNELSQSAVLLWHALMHLNNKSGWQESFTVARSVIEAKTGLKKDAYYSARNKLQQKGLIDFKTQKNKATTFRMNSLLSEKQTADQTATQTATQTTIPTADQTATQTITKLNKTKQSNGQYTDSFLEFWEHYPRKVGKKDAFKKWKTRIKDHTPDDLIRACKNYAYVCKKDGTDERFIKHAKTFLSDTEPFLDYLKAKKRESIDHEDFIRRKNQWINNGGDPDEYDFDAYKQELANGG